MPKPSIRPLTEAGVLQARPKTFHQGGKTSHGVGLFLDKGLVQFLTPEQALTLANQIADSYAQTQENKNA